QDLQNSPFPFSYKSTLKHKVNTCSAWFKLIVVKFFKNGSEIFPAYNLQWCSVKVMAPNRKDPSLGPDLFIGLLLIMGIVRISNFIRCVERVRFRAVQLKLVLQSVHQIWISKKRYSQRHQICSVIIQRSLNGCRVVSTIDNHQTIKLF